MYHLVVFSMLGECKRAHSFSHIFWYPAQPAIHRLIEVLDNSCYTHASVLLIFLIRKKQTVADRSLSPICEALSIEILSLEEQLTIAVRTSPCCGISHVQVPPSFVRNLSANIGLCERKVDLATTR